MTAIEHIDTLMLARPEDLLTVRSDAPAFFPIDAIYCATNRAEAVISLLMERHEGDKTTVSALDAIAGHIEEIRTLTLYAEASTKRTAKGV